MKIIDKAVGEGCSSDIGSQNVLDTKYQMIGDINRKLRSMLTKI